MKRVSTFAFALVLGVLGMSSPANSTPVHRATFKGGASSTGWIDFDFYDESTSLFRRRLTATILWYCS